MANIELVIKIPEECYKQIQKHMFSIAYDTITTKEEKKQVEEKFNVVLAIKNGTPLPKGHGELIDRQSLKLSFFTLSRFYKTWNLGKNRIMGEIENAQTIIEADRSEE